MPHRCCSPHACYHAVTMMVFILEMPPAFVASAVTVLQAWPVVAHQRQSHLRHAACAFASQLSECCRALPPLLMFRSTGRGRDDGEEEAPRRQRYDISRYAATPAVTRLLVTPCRASTMNECHIFAAPAACRHERPRALRQGFRLYASKATLRVRYAPYYASLRDIAATIQFFRWELLPPARTLRGCRCNERR